MTDVPHRAYRLVLDLEADDYRGLIESLEHLSLELDIDKRPDGAEITSGGVHAGWHLEITHDSGQTASSYHGQLMQWIDARRKAARTV